MSQEEHKASFKDSGNNYGDVTGNESIWGKPGEIITRLILRNVKPGDSVVDGPSGDGRYTEIIGDAAGELGHIINIDLDEQGLERTYIRIGDAYKARVKAVKADLTEPLPKEFSDNSVDRFMCLGFIHLIDPKKLQGVFFPEVMRILKPGGTFFGNFLVNVVRTDLNTGLVIPTVEFAEQDYSVEEGLALLMKSFADHNLTADTYRGLEFDYPDANPPYHWSGSSIVFEVQKMIQ
ncbi:MAG: class I SAM-dependent methyltransferase [Candidatus Roizmanbacteria bacterium]|nr:class I SAM-dependent methyltransferase [Candidatus Roizmanbacteria bacterium]